MFKQYLKKNDDKVISTVDIPANVPVIEFTGDLASKEDIKNKYDYCLQIGNDLYLTPSGGIDDDIKHSCNPNCYVHIVGKRATLYSKYLIKKKSELTFDYSLCSTDLIEEHSMKCNCGYIKCRKVISGYQYLDENLRKSLEKSNYVPLFQYIKFIR